MAGRHRIGLQSSRSTCRPKPWRRTKPIFGRRKARFAQAFRRYYPGIDPDRLAPDYAGIRPMLPAERNVQLDDWMVHGPADHGIAGLVHLFGISTPGLTASLVLGR